VVPPVAPAIPASPPVTIARSDSSDGPGFAAAPLPSSSGFAPPGSIPLLVGSGLDPYSLSSQALAAPVEKKKSAQTPMVPVEEKKFSEGLEAPSRVLEMYPGLTEEQRHRLIEIWGKMIERKKHESKRELRNLQSSVNYRDIKASSRCSKDKAIRS
jgi:hypothetical protein